MVFSPENGFLAGKWFSLCLVLDRRCSFWETFSGDDFLLDSRLLAGDGAFMTNWRFVFSGIGIRRLMAFHVGGCSTFSICMFRSVHPLPPFSGDGIGFMGVSFTEIFFALLIPLLCQLRFGDDLWRFVVPEGDLGRLWSFYVYSFLCLFVSVFWIKSVIVSFSGLFFSF